MFKTVVKYSLLAGVLLASQACTSPTVSAPDPNSVSTLIAQTQTAQPGIPVTGPDTPTPAPTTLPTLASTPTPVFTSTASVPQISVSIATNCRTGPGLAYPRVGALLPGETAEVVGRNSTSDYWIIRNPDRTGELCWLWGQYAVVMGNTSALPVYTPPPPPPPTATMTPTITRTPAPSATHPSTPASSPMPTSTSTP